MFDRPAQGGNSVATASEIDLSATEAALRRTSVRIAELLRDVSDPSRQVPGLDWSVAETAAHIVSDLRLTVGVISEDPHALEHSDRVWHEGESPSARMAASNDHLLREFAERDVAQLGEMLVDVTDEFLAASRKRQSGGLIQNQSGVPMTLPTLATTMLGEQLIHGFDIARAFGARWPITRDEALLVLAAIVALVPEFVDVDKAAGVDIVYELRFRGGSRYRIAIEDGVASVGPPYGGVDCWINADPVAFLLVGYGRVGQWSQVLRGRIIAGGRKPWLATKFATVITTV
jgi:uncharacterized protein (TIGR03083 family)